MLRIMKLRGCLLIALALAGCRALPAGAAPSDAEEPESAFNAAAGVSSSAPSQYSFGDAPVECGFPPGTVLEFAGRSTTAELGVQEVVGDPMSDDPADIYITRDAFDQGELHGRLVCAVFVNDPGFVEITVHPEDGGRFVPPTPFPSVAEPVNGIAEDDAIEVARGEVPEPEEWRVAVTEAGPIGTVLPHVLEDEHYDWAQGLSPELWVWRVFLVRGDEGVDVVIDYVAGAVLGTAAYIVN
jgi:hypothetical protein